MYAYKYDEETGGIELLDDDTKLHSNEPRPVYAQEMDFIGMNAHWNYKKQNDIPYLWAESGTYWYRGKKIAKVTGGSLCENPILEPFFDETEDKVKVQAIPNGTELIPINLSEMVERNRERMTILEQITVKMIYNYYKRKKRRKLFFHVAFSGGKDSIVLLDLVKRAIPRTAFMVVFGDTGMEFPDTYDVINQVEQQCIDEEIEFYRAASHFDPMESWRIFGPPSRVLRWCCSVHKSAPQTIKIREKLEKNDYVGVDFVGVRKYESLNRSNYDYENYGKKQKGQYSQNPILDWSSAEIWLYIYMHNLIINETYKKGNSRAGCLFCPMGGGKGDFFQYKSYPGEIDRFINIIKETNERDKGNPEALETYVTNGGWNARKNGRDLINNKQRYKEETKNSRICITVTDPLTDWHEWIKTIEDAHIDFEYTPNANGYTVSVNETAFRDNPANQKKFKQVFKKAAHCVGCRVCEADCSNNCISFKEGLKIDGCLHCGQCHEIADGCLAYHSLRMPAEGEKKMNSINSFANHAPKTDWVLDYLSKGDVFWEDNTLGPNQVSMFKRFLRETGLMADNHITGLFHIMNALGAEHPTAWGLLLSNFAYNAQCSWYIKNMDMGYSYLRDQMADMLINDGVKKNDATSIINAFKRFCELPLGTALKFGAVVSEEKKVNAKIISLTRTKTSLDDGRVILYSLFKFAEACEGYYQFTLSRLLDYNVESSGISPAQIFGLGREEMEQFLNGLTANYPEFINATFTHDLEKISLMEDKTSEDVLRLFEE